MGVKPPVDNVYTSEQIWSYTTDGLGEIDRHFPGRKVLEATPDTRRGLLKFRLAGEGGKISPAKDKAEKKPHAKEQIYVYDVETKTVSKEASPVFRSEILRNILRYSRRIHAGSSFDKMLSWVWIAVMLISMIAILSGFLFNWLSGKRTFGRITTPNESSSFFWSDTHSLTGAVTGAFLFVLAFTGILQAVTTDGFTKELREHEGQAAEYFSQIDAEYGPVSSNEVLLPAEALRRLRADFPADDYRLLSMKFPTKEKAFFAFYLTESPYGFERRNAVELVGMRLDGENIFVVTPSPASKLLARAAQLHRLWPMNGAVRLLWGVYLLMSLAMLVSGMYVHIRRHQKADVIAQASGQATEKDRLWIPLSLSVLVVLSFFSMLIDSSGYFAALLLLIPLLVIVYKLRKEN